MSPATLQALEDMWETLQTAMTHFERIQSQMDSELHQQVEDSLRVVLSHIQRIRRVIQTGQR